MLSIDFETFYDDDYSLKKMSTWDYVYGEQFDAYMVSLHGPEITWYGHPKDCDWSVFHGQVLVAHNVNFDGLVFKRLQELGIIPKEVVPAEWVCSAEMSVYFNGQRDLVRAVYHHLPGTPRADKAMRDLMKGLTVDQAIAQGYGDRLRDYVIYDAVQCYRLAEKLLPLWPASERIYARNVREAGWRGAPVAAKKVADAHAHMQQVCFDLAGVIPWGDEKPLLSHHAFRAQARKEGILTVPASLAKDNPTAAEWFKEHRGDTYPWVGAYQDLRSANSHALKVKVLHKGAREDGTFPLQVLYFGAHTGRLSAGSGESKGGKFNSLNMPQQAKFGVNLRNLFEAPEGYTFIICDYAQIEAIMLLWRVGDQATLDAAVREGNLYQAYAKVHGWYPNTGTDLKTDDNETYQRAKVSVLQLGYQSGADKFRTTALMNYGVKLTEQESVDLVQAFRGGNPKIVNHWNENQMWAAYSANHGDETHEIGLRSGRDLVYVKPHWTEGSWADGRPRRDITALTGYGGRETRLYGGILVENEIQATARDVMRDGRNAVVAAGHNAIMEIYDELVVCVREDEAEDIAKEIQHLMVSSSPWAEGCPLGAEYSISKFYLKD